MKSFAKVTILFLFLISLTACYKDVEYVDFNGANVEVEDNVGVITLFVKLKNPNFYTIKIVQSDIDIYLNDKHLGIITTEHNVVLPKKSETIVELPIEINILDLVFNVPNIVKIFKSQELKLGFEGTITGKVLFGQKQFFISEEQIISL